MKDAAVMELLFTTEMRISELCSLGKNNIHFGDTTVLIYGKGSKERQIQIGSEDVIKMSKKYQQEYQKEIQNCQFFFVSQAGMALSDQAARRLINKYTALATIDLHITPYIFRHTFASSPLETDVDIRYIQEMLGHSSIDITKIYMHIAVSKQKDIFTTKHPRKNFHI